MKVLLIILVVLELFFALLAVSPIFVYRTDLKRAVYNYSQEPTEENKAKMKAEQEITARIRLRDQMILVALFAANTWGLIIGVRKLNRASKTTQ
jgi:hypothetical protein